MSDINKNGLSEIDICDLSITQEMEISLQHLLL